MFSREEPGTESEGGRKGSGFGEGAARVIARKRVEKRVWICILGGRVGLVDLIEVLDGPLGDRLRELYLLYCCGCCT